MILDPSDLTFVLQDIVRQKMVDVVIGCLHSICDDVIDVGRVPAFSRTITFRPKWAKSQNVLSQLRFVSLFRFFFQRWQRWTMARECMGSYPAGDFDLLCLYC